MRWALTDAPGGNQRPMTPSGEGSSGHDTAPPEEGLPSSTINPQVGSIAQRPRKVRNMVNTIPVVNMVGARIDYDSRTGSRSAPSSQSTIATMKNAPSAAYAGVKAIRSPAPSRSAWALSLLDEQQCHRRARGAGDAHLDVGPAHDEDGEGPLLLDGPHGLGVRPVEEQDERGVQGLLQAGDEGLPAYALVADADDGPVPRERG
ncbi:hypothetical protein ACIBQ1_33610 [Nonomuraea sp. NPDC050153]|uniref:hypothetical protein n=1 Tax=Nonomuraea sp. NPDC050153 TaxID=3364359 RepID=UPI0037ACA2E7